MKRHPAMEDGCICQNVFQNKRGFLIGDVTHWMPLYPLPNMYLEIYRNNRG